MKKKFLLLGLRSKDVVHEVELTSSRFDEFRGADVTATSNNILGVHEGTFNTDDEAQEALIKLMEDTTDRYIGNGKFVAANKVYNTGYEIRTIFVKE